MRADGVAVYHGSYSRGSGLGGIQSTLLKGMRILPSFPLSLWIDPTNGHAQVSLLVAGPESTLLSLVDLDYDHPAAPPGNPKVFRFRSFPGNPVSGYIFQAHPDGHAKRKVVVVVNDKNEVYAMKHLGKLVLQKTSLSPAQPLSVMAGKSIDYLLYTHPDRGLRLQPISD
jgi:hypothetical protein